MIAPGSSLGHLDFRPEPRGEVRRIPHLIGFENRLYPSLALSAAMLARSQNAPDWVAKPGQIEAPDGFSVALDGNGETLINWLGGDGTFPTFSVVQLLNGRVPRGALRGATRMIGNTRSGSFSPLSTPFSSPNFNNQSALHLQANAFDDIVSGRVLRPVPPLSAGLVLLAVSLGAGVLLSANALGFYRVR